VLISCNLVVAFIVLSGCGVEEYRDTAFQGQAKRSLNLIKNSLEQYWLEKGSYPPDRAPLGEYLEKYVENWEGFVTESFSEPPFYLTQDSLTTYMVVAKAKDHWKTPLFIRNQRSTIEKEEKEIHEEER